MLSRRQTLVAGAGTMLGSVLGVPGAAGATTAPLRRKAFVPLVGAAVTLSAAGRRHEVTIAAATGTDDAFALRFTTTGRVPEGIYRVGHPDLAPVDLFVSPVGPTKDRVEAVGKRTRA